jgi:hypothetical protein
MLYLGLPWSALVWLGLSWSALVCLGLPWPAVVPIPLPLRLALNYTFCEEVVETNCWNGKHELLEWFLGIVPPRRLPRRPTQCSVGSLSLYRTCVPRRLPRSHKSVLNFNTIQLGQYSFDY